MSRKLIAIILTLAFVLAATAGCGTPKNSLSAPSGDVKETVSSSSAGERKQISFWFFGPAAPYQEHLKKTLVDPYNNSQTEYTLTVEFRNTVDKDIPVALAANSGPDIVYSSGPSFVSTYAQEKKVMNLDKYAEQYGWKDRLQSVLYNACTMDGSLYSLPTSVTFDGFFYNKKLFAEKGWEVPTTMEALEKLLDEAIADGLYACAVGNKGWRPNNDTITSIMVNHFIPPSNVYECLTGTQKFTNPEMVKAIAKTKEWYTKGYLAGSDYTNLNSQECLQLLADKRAAIAFNQCQYFQFAAQSFTGELENDLGFAPLPSAYTNEQVYHLAIPSTLSINAATPYADECAKILDKMMTPEFYTEMTKGWPGYWAGPLKSSKVNTDDLTGLPKVFLESVQRAAGPIEQGRFAFHPGAFFPPQTMEKWREIDMVWQGVMTPEEFCASVDKVATQEIAENKVCPLTRPSL